ncbi:hypothetical protein CLV92_106226 [Kineococcus xinjiangensis]|uniref:Uncharacterized protein n=2 Tax=Kineococcus xinjiangensis TaxID=512762 RepID=A0A2S6IME9_9ACTN|nr:hypothetical protein CLV92_106226 [Kineococcus xinjiangensis]
MAGVGWRPLTVRAHRDLSAYEALYEGVPAHLRPSLRRWFLTAVPSYRRALALQRLLRWDLRLDGLADLHRHLDEADGDAWLDAVDCALHLIREEVRCACEGTPGDDLVQLVEEATVVVGSLSDMLDDAGSAWTVDVSGVWGLERRATPLQRAGSDAPDLHDHEARAVRPVGADRRTLPRDGP